MTVLNDDRISASASATCNRPFLVTLTQEMIEDIVPIEHACHAAPWSAGNFRDALQAGYHGEALLAHAQGPVIGYDIAMRGVDEVHLLNITVAPAWQRQGCARLLLESLRLWTLAQRLTWLWLEVRQSNIRALKIYEHFGFRQVGLRKNYYPTLEGEREHAVLMSLRVC